MSERNAGAPKGQIEDPDVPTPADAIELDPSESATPAVANDDWPEASADVPSGTPGTLLPPGAYVSYD